MLLKKRVDNLSDFPRSAVHTNTEACLTSVFEMGTGEPCPYGRPISYFQWLFIKVTQENNELGRITLMNYF